MLRELAVYYRPTDLHEALTLLAAPGNVVALAGGSELLARSDSTISAVVDLQSLRLDYVRFEDGDLHIGAMTRLQSLVTDAAARISLDGAILQSVIHSALYTERCAATIGGTVASAPSRYDLLPSLLALDASVMLQDANGQQSLTVDELLSDRKKVLTKGTLVTELLVPRQPSGARFACLRVSRTPADRAIVNVVVRAVLQDDQVRDARIAVGGAASHALRLKKVETALRGADLEHDEVLSSAAQRAMQAVEPPSDHLASAEYRREMVGVLLKRAFLDVKEKHA